MISSFIKENVLSRFSCFRPCTDGYPSEFVSYELSKGSSQTTTQYRINERVVVSSSAEWIVQMS